MTEKYNGNRIGLEEEKLTGDRYSSLSSKTQETLEENSERYGYCSNVLVKMRLFILISLWM